MGLGKGMRSIECTSSFVCKPFSRIAKKQTQSISRKECRDAARLLVFANTRQTDRRLSVCCCLSVAYIGPKSRTERSRKTKIGTEVAHVARDSDTTFKVKR